MKYSMLIALFLMTSVALGQDSEVDHPFIQGWNGVFAHGETVNIKSLDLARDKTGQLSITLGNHPDISQCTKFEDQAVYEWYEDSVAIQVNADDFTTGDMVYIFLTGEEGAASSGYAVTLGDQIPRTEGPGQPGQPFVIEP